MWMVFDYRTFTIEDIEMYDFYEFICDGDSMTILAKPKED